MSLTDESNNMVMPVAPMYGNGGGFGNGFGTDGWWIILLLLVLGGGAWNNGFGGGANSFAADGAMLYPWMNQAQMTAGGFQNAATQNQITGIQSGINDIQTQLCGGFSGVNATVSNGFAQAEIANNSRQIANMQQNFASQTAVTGAISDLASQQASCCCENRLASANLVNTIQSENCADRQALNEGVRDIIANQTAGIQTILDKLCQQEIDAKNNEIDNLRTQLNMQNLAASQSAQTAQLIADNNGQTRDLINRIAPYPVPSYVVPNPYSYGGNCGCGCGA